MNKNALFFRHFLIFSLFLLLVPGKCDSNETVLIKENELINIYMTSNAINVYIFYPTQFSHRTDLTLTFSPILANSTIGEIVVGFSTNDNLSQNGSSNQVCKSNEFFSCLFAVPESSSAINIFIHCLTDICEMKARISHIEEIHLNYNRNEYFRFKRSEIEKFNFTIPGKYDFSRIVLSVSYKYRPFANKSDEEKNKFSSEEVISNSGKPITYKLYDRHVLTFTNKDEELCYNCNITTTITSAKETIIEIELFLYTERTLDLISNKLYIDYLKPNINNEYVYTLPEPIMHFDDFNVLISINSLSGKHKTLYLNIDSTPDSVEKFHWKSSTLNSFHEEEDIVVTKKDIEFFRFIGRMYFITVLGDSEGLYSIYITVNRLKILPLYFGIKQSGLIRNDEIIYYELQFWKREDMHNQLTLAATVTLGHISIYGRSCGQLMNCSLITMDDIQKKNKIDYEINDKSIASLKFDPQCEFLYCFYLFAVVGKSPSTSSSKYDLILKKEDGFINLIENICHESTINYMDKEEFRLFVGENNDEIKSVSLFINSDLQYQVSKEKFCENEVENNCSSYKLGNFNNPVIFIKEDNMSLAGTYFLTLFGIKSAEFIIFPEVKRKNDQEIYINLLEGKFLKYFLSASNPIVYFEFVLDSSESINIEINLQSNDFNNFRIFLTNDNTKPSNDNYFMSSANNQLNFDHRSSYEVLYKMSVEAKNINPHQEKHDFSIMYSTGKTLKHLEPNEPFYDTIASGGIKKFLFYVDLNNEIVYFSKHSVNPEDSGKALMMSFSILSNEMDLQIPAITTTQSTIKFNNENINSLCNMKLNQFKTICPLYITIRSDYYQEISYVLIARTKEYAFQIKFGKEQTITFNEEEESINMYILPSSVAKPIDLYLYSLKFTFDTYITIYKNEDMTTFQAWKFPNKTLNDYSIQNKVRVSLVLKAMEFNKCWPKCVVLLTVVKEKRMKTVANQEDLLHILTSNGFSEINDNKIQYLKSEQYLDKFFKYNTQNMLRMKVSLLIDLTNILGISEIYFKISDDSDDIGLPDQTNFDFFTLDGHLTISADDILGKVNGNQTKATFLLIGISCVNPVCESNLLVRTSNHAIRKALHGNSYDIFALRNSSEIFEYFHYLNKNFQVKVNKESGIGKLYIVPCFDKMVEECLLNNSKSIYMHSFSSNSIKVIKSDNETYCFECIYLIAVETQDSNLKGSFNIILENEFLQLSDGHKFYDEVEESAENFYLCISPTKEKLEITVHIYHNDPILYVSRTKSYNKNNYEYMVAKKNDPILSLTVDPEEKTTETPMEEIYIIIYGKSQSNYTISCKSSNSYGVLHVGLMEYNEIKPLASMKYIFTSNVNYSISKLERLTLNYIDVIQPFNLTGYFKPMKSTADSIDKPELSKIELSSPDSMYSLSSETHLLDLKEGIYEFHLVNKLPQKVKFMLLLQNDDITMLPYDIVMNIPLYDNHNNNYETYIPHKGLFLLDLLECIGTVEVFSTDQHEKLLKKEQLDQEFLILPGQSNVKILKVNQGPLYLSFQMAQSLNNQNIKGYGQLSTHLYDNYKEIPQNRLILPSNGEIEWIIGNSNETTNISLSFYPVMCSLYCEDDFLTKLNITYKLIVSKSSAFSNSNGKCGILDSNLFLVSELKNQTVEKEGKKLFFHETLNDSDISYYFNIIAIIEGYPDHMNPISLYYKENEYVKSNIFVRRILTYTVSILMVVIIVLLAGCACYFYGGYKRILNKLKSGLRKIDDFDEEQQNKTISTLNTSIELRNRQLIEEK